MRRIPAVATCAAAVLALALTGCGGDDDKKRDKGASGSTGSVQEPAKDDGKKAGAKKTASPTPSRTKKPKATVSPTPARTSTPTAAATPTRPRTSAPAVPPKKTTRPATGPQSVQGTWYHVTRGSGGRLIVLTVNGTSMDMRSGTKSCPGTITSAMEIRATCMGEVGTGKATLSGGQLTFAWPGQGGNDYFRRTQPPA
ncbi:hypothetical protein GCM10010252_40120 [Streptomyces aureoverticillatus]|nr:hypothetical protein GCM10010252_40120 [Streptomyces aureoverticillatus]